jgi:hypothetical protein
MALDPHDAVVGDQGDAPRTLHQPTDAPPPIGHVRDDEALRSLRRVRESRREVTPRSTSLVGTVRAWAGRVSGRSDRRLLFALAQATEAIAAHCDLLADRLASQETITADVTGAYGEEITQLRAEVRHLQRLVSPHDASHE